jgi:voltage-gated potassium channel
MTTPDSLVLATVEGISSTADAVPRTPGGAAHLPTQGTRVVRDRGAAYERFSRAVDGPLTVLALAMLPLLVLPLVMDLSAGAEAAVLAIDYLIWAVFAAEYAIKLYLAPNRRQFIAGHLPDLIIVVVPMLRPLRVLRSVRLLRLLRLSLLTGLAAKGLREARNILRHRGLNWVLLIVVVLNLLAAAMVLEFERGNPDASIHSYPDALWWAVTTITTVGYGDRFPMSSAGRAVAVVLMIAGIAMFGVITATIAAYFVEQKPQEDVASRLDQIMERLDRIEARMRPGEDQLVVAEDRF